MWHILAFPTITNEKTKVYPLILQSWLVVTGEQVNHFNVHVLNEKWNPLRKVAQLSQNSLISWLSEEMFCTPGPPCGPICTNERVESLLQQVKPQIQTLKEKLNTVSQSLSFIFTLRKSVQMWWLVHNICKEYAFECFRVAKTRAHMPFLNSCYIIMANDLFECVSTCLKWGCA